MPCFSPQLWWLLAIFGVLDVSPHSLLHVHVPFFLRGCVSRYALSVRVSVILDWDLSQ